MEVHTNITFMSSIDDHIKHIIIIVSYLIGCIKFYLFSQNPTASLFVICLKDRDFDLWQYNVINRDNIHCNTQYD